MGARLPFRNMYHKGIYLFLGKMRYYAPDENGGLFQWADHLPTVTFSLSPLRALSPTCPIPHPPCSCFYVLSFFHAVTILCFLFHLVLPRFHFLPHVSAWLLFSRTHISAWFPPTTTYEFPVFIQLQAAFHYASHHRTQFRFPKNKKRNKTKQQQQQ